MAKAPRFAVLYTRLSGHSAACLKALKEVYGAHLLVVRWPPSPDAPFRITCAGWAERERLKQDLPRTRILREVLEFSPAAVLMSGWMDPDYLWVARRLRRSAKS